ncbi:MAG: diaminopimelate epimerase [Candidatus Thioglobus sp.]|nr:diaminopimelate epimerase [Candidatus Thioglobus sp.]
MINFTKMHGLGNDFMVIDNTGGDISLSAEQIIGLADRHFGVGFDQLLLVEKSQKVDFAYRIFNADGAEVEQCGNGARCFALFVRERGLSENNPIKIETKSGVISLLINSDNTVTADMGAANFEPEAIGLLLPKSASYQIDGVEFGAVSMGNPHLVTVVEDLQIDIAPAATILQHSEKLKNSANIGFMQILSRTEINLRVYERGVGETLACGSGAAAAVAYGVSAGLLESKVLVHLSGGDAQIESANGSILLSAAAQFVFEGMIEI